MLPLDPHPVSDSLEKHLTDTLSQIPTGKRGQLTGAITTAGVEAALGWRVKPNVTVSGWAGREWSGRGWSAGARAGFVW